MGDRRRFTIRRWSSACDPAPPSWRCRNVGHPFPAVDRRRRHTGASPARPHDRPAHPHVARASGIVAWVLLLASLVWGVLLATRVLKPLDRPAWLLAMHRWLSGLAVVCTGLHLGGHVADDEETSQAPVARGPRDQLRPCLVVALLLTIAAVTAAVLRVTVIQRNIHRDAAIVTAWHTDPSDVSGGGAQ